jgi:hypothetical protein
LAFCIAEKLSVCPVFFIVTSRGAVLAKPNYQFEKRQRDLAKKSKQEEKRLQKLADKAAGKQLDGDATSEIPESSGSSEK